MSWSRLQAGAPEIARAGERLLRQRGDGEGLLATLRGDGLPRIHLVNVDVVDGRLYVFVQARSAKRVDLESDGRFALHAHVEPSAPSEFLVRGRARLVEDEATRSAVARVWAYGVNASYPLFELDVEAALLGARASADDWPPEYSTWTAKPDESAFRRGSGAAAPAAASWP